jgi:hypothetical protein
VLRILIGGFSSLNSLYLVSVNAVEDTSRESPQVSLPPSSILLLLITILIAQCICNHTLVFSIYDSTEDGIQKISKQVKE